MMLRTPAAKRPRFSTAFDRSMEAEEEEGGDGGELVRYESNQRLGSYEADADQDATCDEGDSMRCSYKCRNMVKSELLDTLDMREKQVAELAAENDSLRNMLEATQMEKERLLGRVKSLDQSVVAALAQEQSSRFQRAENIEQFEDKFRKQLERCSELQASLLNETRLKADAEARGRAAEAQLSTLKIEFDSVVERSSREIQRLERDIEHWKAMSELPREDFRIVSSLGDQDSLVMGAHIENLQEKINEMAEEKLQLQRKLAELESELLTRVTGSREADIIIKSLREELGYQEAELAEAKKLKDSHLKLERLQDQLSAEKCRADEAEKRLAAQIDMNLRISYLEAELAAWEDMIHSIPGNSTRDDVPKKLAEMQKDTLVMLSENGELKSKVNELQNALETMTTEQRRSMEAAVDARKQAEEAAERAARLEHQILRLTKERDSLRAVLASYDQEEAAIQKGETGAAPAVTPEKARQKRIEELETNLKASQDEIQRLEGSILVAHERQRKSEMLASELADSKLSTLQREADQLREEVGLLERKLACGQFDPSKTKVLKLRTRSDTQATLADHTMVFLHDDTREQGAVILESKQKVAVLTDKVSSLEQEISTLKKRESRYMQVFAEKAFTFRKACGLIFGYEILMNEKPDSAVTLFKLTSIYSRDKDNETLEFQYTSEGHSVGRIDMLANDYTTSPEVERQVTTFLQGYRSIPAFMANLTLEWFNKVTIG